MPAALPLAVTGVLLVYGLARATSLAWICDDSFISLRYAENLNAGLGLVYNGGERVEGYTNLLWTLLLALLMKLGVPAVSAAQAPGIAAYAALALCLVRRTWRRSRATGAPFLPIAAGLVLVSDDFHVWATGGLETMLFAYLVAQGLLLTREPGDSRAPALGAGLCFALLVLTRPDGLLFAAVGAASYWLPRGRLPAPERRARALRTALPVAVVLAVLVPFKLAYYGDLFPTAFYSKSVLRPYPGQGLVYVGLYLLKNWFLVVALGAGAIALWRRRSGAGSGAGAPGGDAAFLLSAALLFVAYLIQVGGDFMFARRLIPVIPLVFVAIEDRLSIVSRPRLRAALAVGALAAAALPVPVFRDTPRIRGIADERRFYPAETIEIRRRQAEAMGRALAGSDVRVAFEGGMCVFGYYSRLPYLVEMTGLTQYSLARQPLTERGHIGHEKGPSPAWLADNDIHLVVSHLLPPVAPDPEAPRPDEIYFGDLTRARVLLYDDAIMDRLRGQPDVSMVPIERILARSRREIERGSLEEAERVLAELERFYFRRAGESAAREARSLREIVERKRRSGSDAD
jgi:hypothetical protein